MPPFASTMQKQTTRNCAGAFLDLENYFNAMSERIFLEIGFCLHLLRLPLPFVQTAPFYISLTPSC